MHAYCAAEFNDSHLCHVGEYHASGSSTPVPSGGAWMDTSAYVSNSSTYIRTDFAGPRIGRYAASNTARNCSNWTALDYIYSGNPRDTDGTVVNAVGMSTELCNVARPLACCSTPFKEQFAGYTSTAYEGDVGGRAIANFHCASEFAGSHICHLAEYIRSTPTVSPPTDGAWADTSAYVDNSSTYIRTDFAGPWIGRYTSSNTARNCSNWTALDYLYSGNLRDTDGTVVKPGSPATEPCNVARPFACCW